MDAIGIDVGSTNVKAVRVGADGRLVDHRQRALRSTGSGQVAEQDAEDLWAAVLGAVSELVSAGGADIGAIGLCGQYSSIVPVDADLRPLAPLRLYLDQRGTHHCHDVLARHPDAFATWLERHPIPPVGGGLALGHLLSFQADEPELHAQVRAYLEPVDYVAGRLTGTVHATQGSVFAGQLVDNRSLTATGYDPDLVAMSGVDGDRLPPLVPSGSVVGPVRADVAAQLGLSTQVAVVAGATDSCGQALATGAHRPGRVGVSIGTTGVVLSDADQLGMDIDHEVMTMPGVDASRYLVSAENGIAGRAVEHVLCTLAGPGAADADPFAGFDDALRTSAPGAGGLVFLPWLSGSMSPSSDAAARGGFVGWSLDTQRPDVVRALAEGVAHNLRWLLGPVEGFTGRSTDHVVLTGGAARSAAWCQVVADVLGVEVRAVAAPAHSGAQAMARWAAASVDGVASPADVEVPLGATFEPELGDADVHRATQARFVAAFDAVAPLSPLRGGADA